MVVGLLEWFKSFSYLISVHDVTMCEIVFLKLIVNIYVLSQTISISCEWSNLLSQTIIHIGEFHKTIKCTSWCFSLEVYLALY